MPLKIAYLGNFAHRHCTETHVALSLESLGHEVTRVQETEALLADIDRATWGADLFLWTRTFGALRLRPEAMIDWLGAKMALGLPTVSYHLDLYAGIKRGESLETDPFWRTAHCFTPDGGAPAFFARHGVNHHYLRPGVFGPECVPGTPRKDLAADVVFVGCGSERGNYHPEWGYRRELLSFLVQTYGARFVKHGPPPGPRGRGHIRNEDLNDLYASAKVVVGDTLCLGPEDQREPRFSHAHYWSDRVYETVGRGGFLVHPRIVGLEDEFRDGEHLRFYSYGDFDELRRVIDEALADDAGRARIQAAGQEMVRGDCTYTHRMTEMIDVLRLECAAVAEALA